MARGQRLICALAAALAGAVPGPASASLPPGADGGPVPVAGGATVQVWATAASGAAARERLAWARFLAGLPHGPELGSVVVLLATGDEVRASCGVDASGCYSPSERRMVLPAGEPLLPGSIAAEIARHEYGHHLSASRDNSPFGADTGGRRWFSAAGLCPGLRSGRFVRDETNSYTRALTEGFAEAYRVASGGNGHTWLVDPAFFPSAAIRQAVLADARHPWTGPAHLTLRGRVARGARAERRLALPLDGSVTVAAAATTRLSVVHGTRVLAAGTGTVRFTGCATRSVTVRARPARAGSYRLQVTRP